MKRCCSSPPQSSKRPKLTEKNPNTPEKATEKESKIVYINDVCKSREQNEHDFVRLETSFRTISRIGYYGTDDTIFVLGETVWGKSRIEAINMGEDSRVVLVELSEQIIDVLFYHDCFLIATSEFIENYDKTTGVLLWSLDLEIPFKRIDFLGSEGRRFCGDQAVWVLEQHPPSCTKAFDFKGEYVCHSDDKLYVRHQDAIGIHYLDTGILQHTISVAARHAGIGDMLAVISSGNMMKIFSMQENETIETSSYDLGDLNISRMNVERDTIMLDVYSKSTGLHHSCIFDEHKEVLISFGGAFSETKSFLIGTKLWRICTGELGYFDVTSISGF